MSESDHAAAPAVSVQNVYKAFGRRPKQIVKRLKEGATRQELTSQGTAAVIDASFDVNPGEIFVVMGLSGSGKSTLIRTLNGLQPPTDGVVKIMGQDITAANKTELRRLRREHLAMVFQHFALFPHRTVLDNAAYGLEIQGVDRAERRRRAGDILSKVGLEGWADHYPDALSGGMQQRVGLARALAADTDIMLMDEAFSALDPLIRREMQGQLLHLQEELGKTIVFITHDLNEAMYLGDRIAVMKDGEIAQIGTPADILSKPADDYVASFIADVDRTRVLTAESVMVPPAALSEEEQVRARTTTVKAGMTLQELVPVAIRSDGAVAVEGDGRDGEPVQMGYVKLANLLEAMAPPETGTHPTVPEPETSTVKPAGEDA
ncbi:MULTISPECIES: glycine betaine/L-proline ABC transporter ATP-binding protein [Nesterenkonia]|uniref:quaternary amine ABC transporter ATP-binding protein n=1 Tax=Nesterenkonia TaxID=57494 RepID=UPI001FEF1CA2|nr:MULTISPECIES: glycine betaine/L-proline ABC transporter ATP-binding protein [Nesterenkonia]